MANKIVLKKSSVAAKVPLATDLEIGELAVNLEDQKLYSKKADGTVVLVGTGVGGGGSGDVVGPASATDNAITRYDGTTGKLIQNSTVTLDDNGTLANVNAISLDTTPTTPPTTAGTVYWDAGNGTPSVVLNANTELQLGQENIAKVYNGSGATIPNGAVVAVVGAQGQRPSVALADADSESTSSNTLGIATESIADGAEGFICTFGLVRGLDTSAFTAGDAIYLSQTAGQFTQTRPSAPAHTVTLGWVIKVNASSGEIFVNISNGWELNELHNVLITTPTGGNLLAYDQTNQYWKNINLTDGTGISVTETTGGAITVTNTAPDQVVSITGAGTAVVTGTYPNFTITSNDEFDGTVTSVAATAGTGISITGSPITSSGTLTITNTAPDQIVSITGAGTTSVTGTYPNFTVTSNDQYSGTVTSVSGTGGYGGLTLSGTVTTSGNITLGGTPTGTWPISVSGNAANVSGVVAVANGGTGLTSPGTSGNVLTSNGTAWTSAAPTAGTVIPAGTVMIFGQTAAPTGFTKLIDQDNAALRVVSGTASSGGSVNFSTAFASQTPTGSVSISAITGSAGNTTLATTQIPSHAHTVGRGNPSPSGNNASPGNFSTTFNTGSEGGGLAHSHPFSFSSGSATFTGNALNLAVKYVDVIRATKN